MSKEFFKNIALALGAVVVTGSAFGMGAFAAATRDAQSLSASVAASLPLVQIEDSALRAEAAVLYDLATNRVIYQKNATESLPLASLTKLMAVETVLSQVSPDTPIQITRNDLLPDGDSGFRVGETILLGDLLKFALVASSNDAMEAAASSLGIDPIAKLNEAAAHLGLTRTRFYNATGLDIDESTAGAYGSAYDIARLAGIFYRHHPDLFELTTRYDVQIEQNGEALVADATTVPLQSIPGFVAAKTGYTTLAGGNLVAVFDLEPGRTVIAAVLGSTREERFSDVKTLIEAARESL